MLRLFAWAAAVLAVLLLSLGYTIATGGGQPDATPTPPEASGSVAPSGSAAASVEPTPTATVAPTPGAPLGTIEIHGHESPTFGFEPSAVTVSASGWYTVTFVNDGAIPHNLTFADGTVIAANGGETATGTVFLPGAGLDFICSIPGHADAGMKGSVTISGS